MHKPRKYYVYILSSVSRVIYIGVTNDLFHRVSQHKQGLAQNSFTKRYLVNRLVYFEEYGRIYDAIEREKQLKRWRREKKVKLVSEFNPEWRDLFRDILL